MTWTELENQVLELEAKEKFIKLKTAVMAKQWLLKGFSLLTKMMTRKQPECRGKLIYTETFHINTVNFLDSKVDDDGELWIFTEYCEFGDLGDYFKKNALAASTRLDIMKQVTKGIQHLHHLKPPIAHRDIKPGNVLMRRVDGKLIAKLSDLGIAKATEIEDGKTKGLKTDIGTELYMAPEQFAIRDNKDVTYTKNVDVFSNALFFLAFVDAENKTQLSPPTGNNYHLLTAYIVYLLQFLKHV